MSEEIQQAVQIIRVAYEGIEIAMKLGSGTLEEMKKAVDFLIAILDHEKNMGRTAMRKLLLKGGDMQVLQFAAEDRKRVEKMAKKYGILYSVLPDINKKDGMSEIIFHTEAVPRVNMMIQKLRAGRIATFDDYLKNGDEKELDRVMSFLKDQKKGNDNLHTEGAGRAGADLDGLMEKVGMYAMEKKHISVEEIEEKFGMEKEQAAHVVGQLEKIGILSRKEDGVHKVLLNKEAFQKRIQSYKGLAQRMQTISHAQYKNMVDITVSKQLIQEENDHAVKIRIPGMWGENAGYLWMNKETVMEIHEGKTLLTFLDCDKEYKIYSADNRVLRTICGKELYSLHYDKVAAEVRKRYQIPGKQTPSISRERSGQMNR